MLWLLPVPPILVSKWEKEPLADVWPPIGSIQPAGQMSPDTLPEVLSYVPLPAVAEYQL